MSSVVCASIHQSVLLLCLESDFSLPVYLSPERVTIFIRIYRPVWIYFEAPYQFSAASPYLLMCWSHLEETKTSYSKTLMWAVHPRTVTAVPAGVISGRIGTSRERPMCPLRLLWQHLLCQGRWVRMQREAVPWGTVCPGWNFALGAVQGRAGAGSVKPLWRWWQSNTDIAHEQGKAPLFPASETELTAPGEENLFRYGRPNETFV